MDSFCHKSIFVRLIWLNIDDKLSFDIHVLGLCKTNACKSINPLLRISVKVCNLKEQIVFFFKLFYSLLLPIIPQYDTFAVKEYRRIWKCYMNVAQDLLQIVLIGTMKNKL